MPSEVPDNDCSASVAPGADTPGIDTARIDTARIDTARIGNVTVHAVDGRAVVSVSGDVDVSSEAAFADAMDCAARLGMPLVVDLSEAGLFGSSGIRVLANAAAHHEPADGVIHVRGASRLTSRILAMGALVDHVLVEGNVS